MFGLKSYDKLPSTAREVYRNKLRLDELSEFDPFAMADLNGLRVLKHIDFEDFYKVVNSLRVTDDYGKYMPRQTESIKREVIKTAKQATFLELLYNVALPDENLYIETFKEKLMICLTNLVNDPELPLDRNLSGPEIYSVKEAFRQMLQSS